MTMKGPIFHSNAQAILALIIAAAIIAVLVFLLLGIAP